MAQRLLIIHQGALGDVVLSFYALEMLKRQRGVRVDLLCRNRIGKVAHVLGVVDAWFDADEARFVRLFEKGKDPNLASFFHSYDAVVLVSFSSMLEEGVARYVEGKVFRLPPRPAVEAGMHIARHFVDEFEKSGFLQPRRSLLQYDFLPRKGLSPFCEASDPGDPFFIFHPGSGSRRKRWDLQRFMEVAARLGSDRGHLVFMVGPAELDLLPRLTLDAKEEGFSIETTDNLETVMERLAKARCFIGNDSGLSHLAGYMGTPTVSIFGPSDPKRWAPVGSRVTILRGQEACPPCFEIGEANCDESPCLAQVTVDMVLEAILAFV
jgi:ADP-heptose:LPS heptosyltransferase